MKIKNIFCLFIISTISLVSISHADDKIIQLSTNLNAKSLKVEAVKYKTLEASTIVSLGAAINTKLKQSYASTTDICEAINIIGGNLLDLESKSSTTKLKINDLNLILNEEILKRTNLVNSIKNIFTLKKTDKQILEEVQMLVNKGLIYYGNLDKKLEENRSKLDDVKCVNSITEINREDADSFYLYVDDLSKDEDKYIKNFSQTVKEKMKVIVKETGVKKDKQKDIKEQK